MPHGTQPTEQQWQIAEALDGLVMSKGVVLDDERLDWLVEWVNARMVASHAQALRAAAQAADGMHDPPAPDCHEWAEWLRARADRHESGAV